MILAGRTLGLLGLGRIGKRMAAYGGVGKVGMGYDYSVFGRRPHVQIRQGHFR